MMFNQSPQPLAVRVDQRGHVWCGVAVLAAALAIPTSEAEKIIKSASLRKYLKAVTYDEMTHALATQGVKHLVQRFPREAHECPSLGDWLGTRDVNCTYLVCITGHWIAVRGNHWVCNMNTQARLLEKCPYLATRVRFTIQLLEA